MKTLYLPRLDLGIVAKNDHLMSPGRDFATRTQPPALRYLVCSTARCGSTLLADVLHSTGAAGDPQEYLNDRTMAAWLRARPQQQGRLPLHDYLADLERRRTTPNGVFGIKAHHEHLAAIWRNEPDALHDFVASFDRHIVITRRDKVAQAVSLYRARSTQLWTSEDRKFLPPDDRRLQVQPVFNAAAIARALSDVLQQESAWRQVLRRVGRPALQVVHEEFVADLPGQARRLFNWLQLDPATPVPAPRLQRQGREDDPMIRQFLSSIGGILGESEG